MNKLTVKELNKAIRTLKKNHATFPECVWCQYDGKIFKAYNLDDLRLMVIDYVAKQELVKGNKAYFVNEEWKDAKIGEMPTWASISGNCYRVLHRDIIQPIQHDCSGIVRWHDEFHEWK